jgi:hypothetical protein
VGLLNLFVDELLGLRVDLHLYLSADLLPLDQLRDLIIVLIVEDFELFLELLFLGVLLRDPHLRHLELGLDFLSLGHLVKLERSAAALGL